MAAASRPVFMCAEAATFFWTFHWITNTHSTTAISENAISTAKKGKRGKIRKKKQLKRILVTSFVNGTRRVLSFIGKHLVNYRAAIHKLQQRQKDVGQSRN